MKTPDKVASKGGFNQHCIVTTKDPSPYAVSGGIQGPSVSKSNQLHVVIFRFPLLIRGILHRFL